jgi:hypothetical protein
MVDDASRADSVYRWTVRTLYLFAIVVNLYVLVESVKDTPEGQRIIARLDKLRDDLKRPMQQRRKDRLETNKVILEAMQIVEEAN